MKKITLIIIYEILPKNTCIKDLTTLRSSSMTTAIPWYPSSLAIQLKCGGPTEIVDKKIFKNLSVHELSFFIIKSNKTHKIQNFHVYCS